MTIYYFGDFDPAYARNRVLIRGLEENGVDVVICNDRAKSWRSRFRLIQKVRHSKRPQDRIIVGYSDSRWAVPLLRLFGCGPVIWDAFYSIYDSFIFDRKLARPRSLKAFWYWFLDWLSCRLSQKILLDTRTQISYFVRTFGINNNRFIRVFVGSDDSLFYPRERADTHNLSQVNVHFAGKFIPLQGIEHIIRAAKILEQDHSIHFRILGNGQTRPEIMALAQKIGLKNVDFLDRVPLQELSDFIASADIYLGIFGDTDKALRVIPNKIYESVAMGKPVITAKTDAVLELLQDRRQVVFCRPADPVDLAEKIQMLARDHGLRKTIADGGYLLYKEQLTPKFLAAGLLDKINTHHD